MIGIRVARADDGEAARAIYAPIVETTAISFELTPPSADELSDRITATLQTHPWLVEDAAGGRMAGYAYAGPHRSRDAYGWSADVTVYVAEDMRGCGVGRRLYGALLDLLTLQGFRSAFAGIALPNAPSVALHEAVGFTPVGVYRAVGFKLGAWRDVGWWQRLLRPDDAPLSPPVPFAQFDRTLMPTVTFP